MVNLFVLSLMFEGPVLKEGAERKISRSRLKTSVGGSFF
jgi:hypothetical protein